MTDMRDQLNLLAQKLRMIRGNVATEEATKTALIMPFIRDVLGFDVFKIREVIPEFVADVGLKKGEKVDFAILNNEEVAILIECKALNEPLSIENASQLYRYFNVTSARVAVLTNGNEYRFYTDLDEPNKMDDVPFINLFLEDLESTFVPELEKLTKPNFDLEAVLTTAEELKYVSAARRVFAAEAKEISHDMASLVLGRIYNGRVTQRVREDLTPLVQKGIQQFISDQVNYRLTAALGSEGEESIDAGSDSVDEGSEPSDEIVPTQAELQGFRIVQAIVAQHLDPERITIRPAKSYCPVLLDDNNRRTICRLRFNNEDRLRLGVFDADKKEIVFDLARVEDIYSYKSEIGDSVKAVDID